MISEAQYAALLSRIMALEAVLLKAGVVKSERELRLEHQRAAKRLARKQAETEDWIRRQQQ
jgi:hypothetical protein